MKVTPVKPIRCAIYTRVSTDQGLDQEFNSLDAQYLPHHPSLDCLIDVSKDWPQSRPRETTVILNPPPQEWIKLPSADL